MSLSIQKTPTEAFFELKEDPCSILVDVRSNLELSNDGIADLSDINRETVFKEWRTYPSMEINKGFFEELLEQQKKRVKQLFFICRSGIRSWEASEYCQSRFIEIGRKVVCVNILEGLEGKNDPNYITGWKKAGLPWKNI